MTQPAGISTVVNSIDDFNQPRSFRAMNTSVANSWDRLRQSFAEQFEQSGTNFIYRQSQKGEAIIVSPDERGKFVDDFDQDVRRSKWILYGSLILILGASLALSLFQNTSLPEGVIIAGVGAAMIPYFVYYRWAWNAPARALAGRTPIAGARSDDEVRRLRFQRIKYSQLVTAAFAGLALPLIGISHRDPFSGWNRLWLVFGGALVLFAAVQAFRKWRFEQDDSYTDFAPKPSNPGPTEDSASSETKVQLWQYVPLAVIACGLAFVLLVPAGKQLSQTPGFWPVVMLGLGAWSLFTVARGFASGRIQPFARGFYNTYERESQPKRFWVSVAWNTALGGLVLWVSITSLWKIPQQAIEDRCSNRNSSFTPQSAADACSRLIGENKSSAGLTKEGALVYRGISEGRMNKTQAAFEDFSAAVGLQPKDADAYFDRGLLLLNTGRPDRAIADFNRAHELDPNDVWTLANRGLAYAFLMDTRDAQADFRDVEARDKSNPVMLRGEAVLSLNSRDMTSAVSYLTASLKSDPDNAWTFRTRAWAYRKLGDDRNADADLRTFSRLSSPTANNG